MLGSSRVGALAVSDEPTVFWDGDDAAAQVTAWKGAIGFVDGGEPGRWGHARPAMNGTSGRSVVDAVLKPLGVDPKLAWFTDCIDRFFVKAGSTRRRQQADVMADVYGPFADEVGLARASIPTRPSPLELVAEATTSHRQRLRAELVEAHAPTVVTLGEEAQAVLMAVANSVEGPATVRLTDRQAVDVIYGRPGRAVVDEVDMTWYALAHPGNRSPTWSARRRRWAYGLETG